VYQRIWQILDGEIVGFFTFGQFYLLSHLSQIILQILYFKNVQKRLNNENLTLSLRLRCDEGFTYAFTACSCVFKVITLVEVNQGNYFENAFVKRSSQRSFNTVLFADPIGIKWAQNVWAQTNFWEKDPLVQI